MKALLRNHQGKQFVWDKVSYEKGGFVASDGTKIVETNIIDISRDNRSKYVICGNCKEIIKNTPEAIEAHWKEKAKNKNCLTCKNLQESYNKTPLKKTYIANPENPGQFIITAKYITTLYCGYNWGNYTINTPEADAVCKHFACKNADMYPITDTFTTYPHPFEVLPTIDLLLAKKWKVSGSGTDYIEYHHPSTTTLKARVNSKGIVDYFILQNKRNGYYTAMYSQKYDKLFFMNSNRYSIGVPWNFDRTKYNAMLAKIKELFTEVK